MSRFGLILHGVIALTTASPGFAAPAPAAKAADSAAPLPKKPAPATADRIPEPDTIALFLLAGAGLLVGRRLSRSRPPRTPDV